jgi:hypothetical protein
MSFPAHTTSVFDVKTAYGKRFTLPEAKIKLLDPVTKRPLSDSKLVAEVVGQVDEPVEFGVMLLGVTPKMPAAEDVEAKDAETKNAEAKDVEMQEAGAEESVLDTDGFWEDLRVWLNGRFNPAEAKKLAAVFRKAATSAR